MPSPVGLPFAHLNLTRNPFGELTTEELLSVAISDSRSWLSWLGSDRSIVQLLGEAGRGKTTNLRSLAVHGGHWEYAYVAEGSTRCPIPQGDYVLDEVQRLSRWTRMRHFKNLRLRAIATHVEFTEELRRAGRLTLTIQLPIAWTVELLCQITATRMNRFRRAPGYIPWLDERDAERLIEKHGTNVRQVMAELYEAIQMLSAIGPLRFATD